MILSGTIFTKGAHYSPGPTWAAFLDRRREGKLCTWHHAEGHRDF